MTTCEPVSLQFIKSTEDGWRFFTVKFADGISAFARVNQQGEEIEFDDSGLRDRVVLKKSARENLLLAVKAFNKAGAILMQEDGPVTAAEPCFVPPKMRPILLMAEGVDSQGMYLYRVVFQQENCQIEHRFNVEPKLHSLDYDDNFYDAMGKSTSLVRPLFSAIIHFFRAAHPEHEIKSALSRHSTT
ncbi:MAG: hypothetical protein KGS72_13040 [Cyanobacteria bacterium REEB67]|nr:hypothetical protein [Cyanobacteria bacterium REEB67]